MIKLISKGNVVPRNNFPTVDFLSNKKSTFIVDDYTKDWYNATIKKLELLQLEEILINKLMYICTSQYKENTKKSLYKKLIGNHKNKTAILLILR